MWRPQPQPIALSSEGAAWWHLTQTTTSSRSTFQGGREGVRMDDAGFEAIGNYGAKRRKASGLQESSRRGLLRQ